MSVWGAIAGAAGGAANAIQQQRELQMRQLLLNAQLAMMGASKAPSGPSGPDVPTVDASQLAAGLTATPQGGPATPPATSGPVPSADVSTPALPALGAATIARRPGVSVDRIPTDQASVIQRMRTLASGPQTPATPPVATPASAVGGPAPVSAPSGTPTPGMSPTGADPLGPDSGLTAVIAQYTKTLPHGTVDLGQGYQMDVGRTPQAVEGQRALLSILASAAQQRAQFGQQRALEGQREGFEAEQQARQLASAQTLAGERNALEAKLAGARNAVEYAGIAAQIKRADAEMAMLTQGRSDQEVQKVTADLRPYEDQLPVYAKFEAITPAAAQQSPAVAQQALMEALQTGIGGANFQSRLAKLAQTSERQSPDQIVSAFVQKLQTGAIPASQFADLQRQVAINKAALRAQHARLLQQDLQQYPLAASNPGLAGRTDALFGPKGGLEPQPEPYPRTTAAYQQYLQDHARWVAASR